MATAVLIVGKRIVFPVGIRGPMDGLSPYIASMESFFCKAGFFVPTSRVGTETLDMIEGEQFDVKTMIDDITGVLITPSGLVYRYIRHGDYFSRQRIQVADGNIVTTCQPNELGVCFSMALHLTGLDIEAALDLVGAEIGIRRDTYVTFEIAEIVAMLKERNITQEPMCMIPVKAGIDERVKI